MMPKTQYPAHALPWPCTWRVGSGRWRWPLPLWARSQTGADGLADLELLRLTIPRRTYTDNHMRYIADSVPGYAKRNEIKGVALNMSRLS